MTNQNEIPVLNLENIVKYQDKSIISREVLRKPGGTISLFAFDEGEGLSEHTAPFDAFVYILDGEVEIKIAGVPYIVKKGETITMPANIPHALLGLTQFKMLLVLIKEEL